VRKIFARATLSRYDSVGPTNDWANGLSDSFADTRASVMKASGWSARAQWSPNVEHNVAVKTLSTMERNGHLRGADERFGKSAVPTATRYDLVERMAKRIRRPSVIHVERTVGLHDLREFLIKSA
jgi:hypothetical protein